MIRSHFLTILLIILLNTTLYQMTLSKKSNYTSHNHDNSITILSNKAIVPTHLEVHTQQQQLYHSYSNSQLKPNQSSSMSLSHHQLIIIASADGKLFAYDTFAHNIKWIADLHQKLIHSYHSAEFFPSDGDFTLIPIVDDAVFLLSKSNSILKFSTEEITEGLEVCHETSDLSYYTEHQERLFFLDIETGEIIDFKANTNSDKKNNLMILRSKTFEIHALNHHNMEEIWNLTTTNVDIYSFKDYKRNKQRNYIRDHDEYEINRLADNILEIKNRNNNIEPSYRIETLEKVTDVYSINADTHKFYRIQPKIKYQSFTSLIHYQPLDFAYYCNREINPNFDTLYNIFQKYTKNMINFQFKSLQGKTNNNNNALTTFEGFHQVCPNDICIGDSYDFTSSPSSNKLLQCLVSYKNLKQQQQTRTNKEYLPLNDDILKLSGPNNESYLILKKDEGDIVLIDNNIFISCLVIIIILINILIWTCKTSKKVKIEQPKIESIDKVNQNNSNKNDIPVNSNNNNNEPINTIESSTSSSSSNYKNKDKNKKKDKGKSISNDNNNSVNIIANTTSLKTKFEMDNKAILGMGSLGTIVFEGTFQNRNIAVKRLLKNYIQLAKSEINVLMKAEHHNIIRYYLYEEDEEFIYLLLERCLCSLRDLTNAYKKIEKKVNGSKIMNDMSNIREANLRKSIRSVFTEKELSKSTLKDMMYHCSQGVSYLHKQDIVHRDLKPENILITANRIIKIADFSISKIFDMNEQHFMTVDVGTVGWKAPEILQNKSKGKSVDIFSLGCIFYYLATGGQHPFGEIYERENNIINGNFNINLLTNDYELKSLIINMIEQIPERRYTINQVLNHPFFWDESKKLTLIQEFSDYIESQNPKIGENFELIAKNSLVLGQQSWDKALEPSLLKDINSYRQYDFSSIKELIRVIRNKKNHYYELSLDAKLVLGKLPDGVFNYFNKKFPKLFMFIYEYTIENHINLTILQQQQQQ